MTRLGARRAFFQIHKWIGLIFMIVLMPIAATGSLLLAHDMLSEGGERAVPIAAPLPLARYIDAARAELPAGTRVAAITLPTEAHRTAISVRAMRVPAPGEAPRGPQRPITVRLDAVTAQVMPAQQDGGGLWQTLHRLHGSLLIPGWGRTFVGWLGVLMFVSCVSGLWIWWPTVSGFVRGLRWRRGTKFDYNLHHLTGFWIALPLALLSLSGAWISFPAFFASMVGEPVPQRPGGPRGNIPVEAPAMGIDQAAALAAKRGKLAELAMPAGDPARWTATLGDGKRFAIDDATGAFSVPKRPRLGPVARWMRSVHEGEESTGPVWRAIVFVGGVIPVVLGITGFTMWLRARRWRGRVTTRKTTRRARVSA